MPTIGMSKPESLKTREPFSDLFPIDNHTLDAVAENMKRHGYDDAQPIIGWREQKVIIDGHTRLLAAQSIGVRSVPVSWKSFADEDAAVEYAIHCQRDRRNLTDADLARWVAEVDRRKTAGRKKESAQPCANSGRSAAETAKIVGTSKRKVEQIRTVADHATPEVQAAVASGEKSINAAYNETQAARNPTTKRRRKGLCAINEFSVDDLPALFRDAWQALYDEVRKASLGGWKDVPLPTALHFIGRIQHVAEKGENENV